jgi:hypothetical protein
MMHMTAAIAPCQGILAVPPGPVEATAPREPGRIGFDDGASRNQTIANAIAGALRRRPQLRQYRVDVSFQDGQAELTGQVADVSQRDEVLQIVRGIAGVERVLDRLVIRNSSVRTAQAETPEPGPMPKPSASPLPPEPTPIFQAGPSIGPGGPIPGPMMVPPRMPPYAWPTYAPYNNFSRVAYPTLYPYHSWPFIGPFYPFPKIPPGWRSVTLTWNNGYWWYGKNVSGHDWWRVRYW